LFILQVEAVRSLGQYGELASSHTGLLLGLLAGPNWELMRAAEEALPRLGRSVTAAIMQVTISRGRSDK
jgi:hypothetical protein